jgi:1-aminocyclopropane-1-carboxylate deaminase/D-cysteine desulfhydrase-like pyridoxal-dependent ACC family enzyme
MANVRLSKKFSLQVPDFVRGALLAAGVSALTVIQQSLEAGNLKFNWTVIATGAISTFLAYLVKNYAFEPAKVVTTVETNTKAVNATEKIKEVV